jgi:hypothetical protein
MTFTHPDLGRWAKLLGPLVLEARDPNDGQSPHFGDKCRYQFTICNSAVMRRRLPPDSDYWRDDQTGKIARRPPAWEEVTDPITWPLLVAWLEQIRLPSPWSTGGYLAQQDRLPQWDDDGRPIYDRNGNMLYRPITMLTMRSRIEVSGTSWPQIIPCPHCHDAIVWAEAAFAPGYRICRGRGCHRHWMIRSGNANSMWVLTRTRGRGWPYV